MSNSNALVRDLQRPAGPSQSLKAAGHSSLLISGLISHMSDYQNEAADTSSGAEGAVTCSWPLSCSEEGTGTPSQEENV